MFAKKMAAIAAALFAYSFSSVHAADALALPVAKSFNPDISLTLQGLYKKAKVESGEEITGFWPVGHAHGPDTVENNRGFLVG